MRPLEGLRVRQVGPASGGVAVYAQAVADAYRRLGAEVVGEGAALTHVDLSCGDDLGWEALQEVQRTGAPYLVTVHDPGLPVRHALPLPAGVRRATGPFAQKAVDLTAGAREVRRRLESAEGRTVRLVPTLGHWHVPHPLVTEGERRWTGSSRTLGFVGYWSPSKGVGHLVRSWRRAAPRDAVLEVAGASGTRDPYDRFLRHRLARQGISAPGRLTDELLDTWLIGLRAIVLPYRRGWPGGASGVAQRAAELGVPILASDLPQLRAQLGDGGARWVPLHGSGLATAITEALEEPARLVPLADAAHARVTADAGLLDDLLAAAARGALSP